MQITDVRADLLSTGKVLVRVYTDAGIVGYAEGPGRSPRLVHAYIDDVIKPVLVGSDPRQIERHWESLALGYEDRATKLPYPVVGAIDIALWDILGKDAGLPVHALMGGAARKSIKLYWSVGNGWNKTPGQMLERVREGWDRGFRAFKIRMDWRAYRQDADPEKDFQMFRLVREFVPSGDYLGFDANNGYSVSTAITQGLRFQELGIDHFEEPLPQYDLPGLRQVVDHLAVAISTGEQDGGRWRFKELVDMANPDILQPDILNAGGVSEVKRIYDLAVMHNKQVMPHSPSAGINSIASLHAYSTVKNAVRPHEFSTEFSGPLDEIAELYGESVIPDANGYVHLSDRPGLGLEVNEAAIEKAIVR